ncbi:hypothetical protein FEM48_Zijuj01G0241400 [Ziziphus jujuba var. spinosa]|uniref:glycerophosphodiester phosphodiesterase n=1 Tax=Ziziphus jujuba var. spinosa TaxID=714518 RepID=A0A978W4D4_ZIZJJ|nr:hypothetical protein FEM48_Zijuj01G0241400 [Ziziphus jujuba var. spinosa]
MLPAMCNSRALVLLALLLQSLVALVSAQGSNATAQWQTLSGDAPLVIAHGGFSGLFPDSSYAAYSLALITSLPNVQLWCDVQLTKDEAGICFRDLRLDNSSSITNQFEKGQKEYPVNGVRTKGWFAVDYTLKQLADVVVTQGVYSRTNKFDGNLYSFLTIDDVATQFKPPGLWLNVQHDIFYNQHNLSMRNFIISASRRVVISYISSPEVGFLRSIKGRISPKTKLVFRFLTQDEIEPSTNQTYGSLLKNLTFIKTFASGILVPKFYIWPEVNLYLEPQTSLVSDAHKEKLEVFASEFMNDYPLSYNYSYDPIAEYLNFIETGGFSVDGVLSDFPITPSEAIECNFVPFTLAQVLVSMTGEDQCFPAIVLLTWAKMLEDKVLHRLSFFFRSTILEALLTCLFHLSHVSAKPLVISQYGASGDYPSCTNLAYENAIADGVDVIDCPVQMSKDGTPFCFSSINLIDSTTVAQSPFSSRTRSIPQIKAGTGIFTFSLTWDEIQTLTRNVHDTCCFVTSGVLLCHERDLFQKLLVLSTSSGFALAYHLSSISSPFSDFTLFRNPRNKNSGKFLTLSEFLNMTKNVSSLSVLISIEHAGYLAEEQNLGVTDAVLSALSKASFAEQKVFIQSSNSSVLAKFQGKENYKLVYRIEEKISDIDASSLDDIKKFASSVVVNKDSVFPETELFLTGTTNVVKKLQSSNLSVYVETFNNEFVSQPWDFFSDATVEINSYVMGANIDGVITPFPKTAARYKKNQCLGRGSKIPAYMSPVQPDSLIQLITTPYLPPAEAPNPVLTEQDVTEPPLPSVSSTPPASSPGGSAAAPPPKSPNAQPKVAASSFLLTMATLLAALSLF